MFKDFNLRYQIVDKESGEAKAVYARYVCWRVVFCITDSHFVVAVNTKARIGEADLRLYDVMSQKGEGWKVKRSLTQLAKKYSKVVEVVHVRILWFYHCKGATLGIKL